MLNSQIKKKYVYMNYSLYSLEIWYESDFLNVMCLNNNCVSCIYTMTISHERTFFIKISRYILGYHFIKISCAWSTRLFFMLSQWACSSVLHIHFRIFVCHKVASGRNFVISVTYMRLWKWDKCHKYDRINLPDSVQGCHKVIILVGCWKGICSCRIFLMLSKNFIECGIKDHWNLSIIIHRFLLFLISVTFPVLIFSCLSLLPRNYYL